MKHIVGWMDRHLYPAYRDNWDDLLLRAKILARVRSQDVLLDLGAGCGIVAAMNFRGCVSKVCGIDLDPRVLQNPFLDDARLGNAGQIPYPDNSFDLVFADNVLEHLADPASVIGEVYRVLRPGGWFLAKTPNRRHYVSLLARMTPLRFHRIVNRWRGRAESDTFPTLYRANTAEDLKTLAGNAGLVVDAIEHVEGRPEYLRFNALTYLVGWLYERLVNAGDTLQRFRVLLVVHMRKPSTGMLDQAVRKVGFSQRA